MKIFPKSLRIVIALSLLCPSFAMAQDEMPDGDFDIDSDVENIEVRATEKEAKKPRRRSTVLEEVPVEDALADDSESEDIPEPQDIRTPDNSQDVSTAPIQGAKEPNPSINKRRILLEQDGQSQEPGSSVEGESEDEKRTSPWVWVGVTTGVVITAGMATHFVGCAGFGAWGCWFGQGGGNDLYIIRSE